MLVMQTVDLRQRELVQKEPKPIRKGNGGKWRIQMCHWDPERKRL